MRVKELYRNIHLNELKIRKLDFIFIQVGNQRCFLVGPKEILDHLPKKFQFSIEEQVRNSISRQIMDYYNKGKIPQSYRTEIMNYYAYKLDTPNVGAYKAYQIIL